MSMSIVMTTRQTNNDAMYNFSFENPSISLIEFLPGLIYIPNNHCQSVKSSNLRKFWASLLTTEQGGSAIGSIYPSVCVFV